MALLINKKVYKLSIGLTGEPEPLDNNGLPPFRPGGSSEADARMTAKNKKGSLYTDTTYYCINKNCCQADLKLQRRPVYALSAVFRFQSKY